MLESIAIKLFWRSKRRELRNNRSRCIVLGLAFILITFVGCASSPEVVTPTGSSIKLDYTGVVLGISEDNNYLFTNRGVTDLSRKVFHDFDTYLSSHLAVWSHNSISQNCKLYIHLEAKQDEKSKEQNISIEIYEAAKDGLSLRIRKDVTDFLDTKSTRYKSMCYSLVANDGSFFIVAPFAVKDGAIWEISRFRSDGSFDKSTLVNLQGMRSSLSGNSLRDLKASPTGEYLAFACANGEDTVANFYLIDVEKLILGNQSIIFRESDVRCDSLNRPYEIYNNVFSFRKDADDTRLVLTKVSGGAGVYNDIPCIVDIAKDRKVTKIFKAIPLSEPASYFSSTNIYAHIFAFYGDTVFYLSGNSLFGFDLSKAKIVYRNTTKSFFSATRNRDYFAFNYEDFDLFGVPSGPSKIAFERVK